MIRRGGTELLTANKKVKKHILQIPSKVSPNEFSKDSDQRAGVSDGTLTNDNNAVSNGSLQKHSATMFDLIQLICRDVIVERHGMLVEPDGSMKPGILVLINDADWELEGEMEYELQDGDQICLISTLHGKFGVGSLSGTYLEIDIVLLPSHTHTLLNRWMMYLIRFSKPTMHLHVYSVSFNKFTLRSA